MSRASYSQTHTKTHTTVQAEEVSVRTLSSDATSIKEGSEIPRPQTFTPPPVTDQVISKKKGGRGLIKITIWLIILIAIGVLGYLYLYPYIKSFLTPGVA